MGPLEGTEHKLIAEMPPSWRQECDCSTTLALERFISGVTGIGQCDACAPMFTDEPVTLATWLHITDRCNLRCAYCYLEHRPADMTLETGYAAIDTTFRAAQTYGYRQIRLKYAGGEPLLRFPLVAELQQYAQALAISHRIALDGVVLSNGTLLTSEIITTMQVLGLRLMISLDGLGSAHDCQRSYPGAHGSATDVIRGIECAISHSLYPHISVTVSGRNAAGLPDLVAWLLSHNLSFNFNFYRENSCSSCYADLHLEEATIIEAMLASYKVIEDYLPACSSHWGLIDRAHLEFPHTRPCSACYSYLVFDDQGRVFCCPMHMQYPVATVDDNDPLALVRTSTHILQNPSVDEKEGCGTCAWKYVCAGGCPITTQRATGRYDRPSPHCSIYTALYPEAMRLEQLCRQRVR